MTTSTFLVIATVFGAAAIALFAFTLRDASAVVKTAEGVIVAKALKPAGTYTQVPVGISRGMRMPTDIPIAESYSFEIRVDGLDQNLSLDLNTVASRSFEVGQRVRVTYKRRGIPFASKKYLVLDMEPADRMR